MINTRFFYILSLLFFIQMLFSYPVYAQTNQETTRIQESFRITPVVSDIHLTPGIPFQLPLIIENLSDSPSGIHVTLTGFDEERLPDDPVTIHQPVLTQWTKLSESDFVISPHDFHEIQATITVPSGTKQSGYYEVIYFTPFISGNQVPNTPIVLSRIGALVFATVGTLNTSDLLQKVTISNFLQQHIFFSNTIPISFSIKNDYFTHFTAKPQLEITSLTGQKITVVFEEKHVLPHQMRLWNSALSLSQFGIFYTAQLAVSVGEGKQLFFSRWFFVIPPIVAGSIVVLFLFAFILLRKLIKKKK